MKQLVDRQQRAAVGLAALLCLLQAAGSAAAGNGPLLVSPARVTLADLHARRQLLVSVPGKSGPVDATVLAEYRSSNPQVVRVDARGCLAPVATGSAKIEVSYNGQQAAVEVEVTELDERRPVHFAREIVPIMTRAGCNAGGCHGKASGQNGFKLSLFGFDPAFDYLAIVSEARGRRVFPSAPDRSLLLLKASGTNPHGGGQRLPVDGDAYRLVRRWIEQGMPREAADAPIVTGIVVEPRERVMSQFGKQQLCVTVQYSDGSTRDVTRDAQFESNDVIASIGSDGLVETNDASGEAAIMARYMGQVAVFKALVPLGEPLAEITGFALRNYIDELAVAKWKKLGIRPSAPASDAEFLRRVTIDLCGRLPTAAEARTFLADTSPEKRNAWVDRLLDSPDYSSFFAMRWGTILRNSQDAGSRDAAYAFQNWLRVMLARNRPYDELVRNVVAAAGDWADAPAINWYWQIRDDETHQAVSDTAQVFLGLRLQCAQCHHHPYERWSQADYYGLAGFFTRISRKGGGEPPSYYYTRNVSRGLKNPLTDKSPEPKLLDGPVLEAAIDQDLRHRLVDWMVAPENPFFAKAAVNRLWGHMLGRGLVDPIDDMRETNPPSNPELLDALARDFIAHKFDLKHLLRTIATSGVYQLSNEPTDSNRRDSQNFARYYGKRLIAEVLLDAVDEACGTKTSFGGISRQGRAVDLPHEGFGSYFLDTFGRPRRVSSCECERSDGANLSQVLLMANSDEIENKITSGSGRIALLVKAAKPPREMIEELYLAVLSRFPTEKELARSLGYVQSEKEPKAALEDLLWSLLNTREFVFNH